MPRTARRDKLLSEWKEQLLPAPESTTVPYVVIENAPEEATQSPSGDVSVTLKAQCFLDGKKRPVGYSTTVSPTLAFMLREKDLIE